MTEMDRPIGGDGNRGRFLSREHWIAALGTVGVLVLSCAGMLVGATLWIESTTLIFRRFKQITSIASPRSKSGER